MVRQDRRQSYGCCYMPKDLMASYIVVMVAAENVSILTLRIFRRRKVMDRVALAVDVCRL